MGRNHRLIASVSKIVQYSRFRVMNFPPIRPIKPPRDAPIVLIVLIDDVGFGASSAFGGPIETLFARNIDL